MMQAPAVEPGADASPALEGLRLLAFCDCFEPGTGGGAERVAFEVYRRLAGWGALVTVVTTSTRGDRNDTWGEGLRVIRTPTLQLTGVTGLQSSACVGATRRALGEAQLVRPNVIHANSLQFQTSLAAARAKKRLGIPMVVTAHIGGFDDLAGPWRWLATLHERTAGRFILSRSDRVIAVSHGVEEHLRSVDEDAQIFVIPNGVDHARFTSERRGGDPGPLSLLLVGRLVRNKMPELAIDAVRRLNAGAANARLTVVGDGPLRKRLERRVRQARLDGLVDFVGPARDVASFVRTADVLIRPTLTEGMPLALLEAMAGGAAVVASNIPGNNELVRHGESGLLFPPGDVAALAGCLRRLVDDRGLRDRLTANARRAVRDHTWDRTARLTADVLLRTAATEPGSR